MSRKLCSLLSAEYGNVHYDTNPSSFKGYKFHRDRGGKLLQLTFPQKIVEAARAHLPELLKPGEVKLPRGKPLAQMADAMALVPNTGKLSHTQVRTQQLIGSLKYIENLHPRISLVMHRLSCVM